MTTVFPDGEHRPITFKEIQEGLARARANSKDKPVASKPSYYAILPSAIRYSDEISWMEKILYAEITALSSKDGYCYATNTYFAKNYNVSTRTVSRAISNLTERGFIFTLLENYGGTNTLRKIYIRENAEKLIPQVVAHKDGTDRIVLGGIDKTVVTPLDKNVQHNNIKENSINSNNTHTPPSEAQPAKSSKDDQYALPGWLGSNTHARLGRIYEYLWSDKMGVPHTLKMGGKNGAHLKSLLAKYHEFTVACMMIVHFEWKGITGTDDRQYKNLLDNGFPLGWIPSRADLYHSYIVGKLGLSDIKKQAGALGKLLQAISDKDNK